MSAAQIIDELPKLTPADLLAVRRKLIEISEENEGFALCDAAASEGAQILDQMETGDGARSSSDAFAFLADSAEDIYSVADGDPFREAR